MVVWAGKGWLAGVVGFLCFLGMELLVRQFSDVQSYYQEHIWPLLLASVVAGLLMRPMAIWMAKLNANKRRIFIDEKTGERVEMGPADHSDTFFFVSVWRWQWVYPGFGVVISIVKLIGGASL